MDLPMLDAMKTHKNLWKLNRHEKLCIINGNYERLKTWRRWKFEIGVVLKT